MWRAEKIFRDIQQVLSSAIEGEHDLRLQWFKASVIAETFRVCESVTCNGIKLGFQKGW